MQNFRTWSRLAVMGCLLTLPGIIQAVSGQALSLTVKVQHIAAERGSLMLALYNQAAGFPGEEQRAYRLLQVPAHAGEQSLLLDDLPPGKYALAVYHDANDDRKLNTNALGIPKEGYGFSNNVRPRFSAPRFEEAAFVLAHDAQIVVTLR